MLRARCASRQTGHVTPETFARGPAGSHSPLGDSIICVTHLEHERSDLVSPLGGSVSCGRQSEKEMCERFPWQ